VEDHHVDRLGVEVQQCMKLTSTNRSIGLIAFIVRAHLDSEVRARKSDFRVRASDFRFSAAAEQQLFVGLVIMAEH
jgi:hypothetical protein